MIGKRMVLAMAATTAVLGALLAVPAAARPSGDAHAAAADISAQARRVSERPRIRVTPGRRLHHRECDSWLQREWRPSGPVVVPKMRCWWVRG